MPARTKRPLVVVDVQPAFCAHWDATPDLMAFANRHNGPLVFLVAADETGITEDTMAGCADFWHGHGLSRRKAEAAAVIDKGFGFLRSWMDEGYDEAVIVKTIRLMRERGVKDSRDLGEEALRAAAGGDFVPDMLEEPLYLGAIDDADILSMEGCLLCGGHRDACLREVELLLQGYGVNYEVLEEFVYGTEALSPAMRR